MSAGRDGPIGELDPDLPSGRLGNRYAAGCLYGPFGMLCVKAHHLHSYLDC